MTDEIKPSVDFTLEDASKHVTGWETVAIEDKFGTLDKLGAGKNLIALVTVFEKRTRKCDWQEIGEWTQEQLLGYFKPQEQEDVENSKSGEAEAGSDVRKLRSGDGVLKEGLSGPDSAGA